MRPVSSLRNPSGVSIGRMARSPPAFAGAGGEIGAQQIPPLAPAELGAIKAVAEHAIRGDGESHRRMPD